MNRIVALLSFLITLIVIFIGGLYTYTSVLCVFFNTIIISVFVGYKKTNVVFQIVFSLNYLLFGVLLTIGIQRINLPVDEQSFILPIFMMVLILSQLGLSLMGLFKVLFKDKQAVKIRDLIGLTIILIPFGLYLTSRMDVYLFITFASIIVYSFLLKKIFSDHQ